LSRKHVLETIRQNGSFLAGLSHDLNNAMAGVLGYCHLLERDPQTDRSGEYLQRIRSQAEFCRDTLNKLQIIAGPVQPRLNLCRGADVLFFVKTQFGKPDVEITSSCPDESVQLTADIDLLRHALCALVENAMTAIESSQSLGTVSLAVEQDEDEVVFRVKDSGPGLDTELEHDRIFYPTVTTKRRGNGVGLGLTVALAIAVAHGGDLRLESSSERGSCFALSIPRQLPTE
jgi:signal transduction histidine kinase